MYFSNETRARMTLDSLVLALLRMFSTSGPVRVLTVALLEKAGEQVLSTDKAILKEVLDAVRAAMLKDVENDAQDALAHLAMNEKPKDELPN